MTTNAKKRDIDREGIVNLIAAIFTIFATILVLYGTFTERTAVRDTTILLVQDNITSQGVVGAVVSVEVAGKEPLDSTTDSRGFVQFVIPDSFWDRPGRIIVEAEGYQKYIQNIDLAVEPLPTIIELES